MTGPFVNGVELLRTYSRHLDHCLPTLRRLERRLERDAQQSVTVRLATAPKYIHKLEHRLPPEVLNQIAVDYEAGCSTEDLMRTYGIGKSTVLRVLAEAGVATRQQGLGPDDEAKAVRLYLQGQSAAKVAGQLGCSPDLVLACVRRAGHSARPRVGGRQKKETA